RTKAPDSSRRTAGRCGKTGPAPRAPLRGGNDAPDRGLLRRLSMLTRLLSPLWGRGQNRHVTEPMQPAALAWGRRSSSSGGNKDRVSALGTAGVMPCVLLLGTQGGGAVGTGDGDGHD